MDQKVEIVIDMYINYEKNVKTNILQKLPVLSILFFI